MLVKVKRSIADEEGGDGGDEELDGLM